MAVTSLRPYSRPYDELEFQFHACLNCDRVHGTSREGRRQVSAARGSKGSTGLPCRYESNLGTITSRGEARGSGAYPICKAVASVDVPQSNIRVCLSQRVPELSSEIAYQLHESRTDEQTDDHQGGCPRQSNKLLIIAPSSFTSIHEGLLQVRGRSLAAASFQVPISAAPPRRPWPPNLVPQQLIDGEADSRRRRDSQEKRPFVLITSSLLPATKCLAHWGKEPLLKQQYLTNQHAGAVLVSSNNNFVHEACNGLQEEPGFRSRKMPLGYIQVPIVRLHARSRLIADPERIERGIIRMQP
ncbi:hypothetical protein NA57DRAFT_55022 [Rhizodiscina lignyota]|uniref:Uncharacterized protein n=1 Tax=Rhizodiscina lignyota TaxID=1504668 RepID=A0A9P4IMP9_9PEZI|nr:hypothetical protein NA57DRAFT_55022 [Rhizodiscina lignyota]